MHTELNMNIAIIVPYDIDKSGVIIAATRLEEEFTRCGDSTMLFLISKNTSIAANSHYVFTKAIDLHSSLLSKIPEIDVVLWMGFYHDLEELRLQIELSIQIRNDAQTKVFFIWERTGYTDILPDIQSFRLLKDKGADGVVALNVEHMIWLAQQGFDTKKIHFIPPGVDTNFMFVPVGSEKKIEQRRELNWANEDLVLLTIGRLESRKRIDFLISSWLSNASLISKTKLVIISLEYGREPQIEKQIHNLSGSNENITIIPYRKHDDLPIYYQSSDIFVLTSVLEGEPSVLIEAMACGLPVVASQIAGHIGLVRHEQTGLLFAPNDPNELCHALNRLVANSKYRKALGDSARTVVVNERDISVVANKFRLVFS